MRARVRGGVLAERGRARGISTSSSGESDVEKTVTGQSCRRTKARVSEKVGVALVYQAACRIGTEEGLQLELVGRIAQQHQVIVLALPRVSRAQSGSMRKTGPRGGNGSVRPFGSRYA